MTANLYRSRRPSLAQAGRPSAQRAQMKAPEGQPQVGGKGTNQWAVTPAPASRIIPPDGPPAALLAAEPPTQ